MSRKQFLWIVIVLIVGLISASVYRMFFRRRAVDIKAMKAKRRLIGSIAEAILPKTTAPGALEAGVTDFILLMVNDCSTQKEQYIFLDGLEEIENYTLSEHGCLFWECSLSDQIVILEHFEEKAIYSSSVLNKLYARFFGEPFVIRIKKLTVEGYCTSEQGATRGLSYDYIPVSYEPCIPLMPHQPAWATR